MLDLGNGKREMGNGMQITEALRDGSIEIAMTVIEGEYYPTHAEALFMADAMNDIRVRDVVLHRINDKKMSWDAVLEAMASCLMQLEVNQQSAALGAVTALALWQCGQPEAAAEVAALALVARPDLGLADLLLRAVTSGLPPEVWGDIMGALTEDDCRYGR
jgi:Domain of unknown function (DUF4192)